MRGTGCTGRPSLAAVIGPHSVEYSRVGGRFLAKDPKATAKITGLRYWMARVLEECEHVSADFSADPVHDLRVSLRRCRSMADGMMAMDPDRQWKAMRKAGKRLFQRLGALRDVQIMMEWIEKLHPGPMEVEVSPVSPGGIAEAGSGGGARATLVRTALPVAAPADPARALLQILRGREIEEKREARAALEEFDRKQWKQWSTSLPVRAARIRPGSPVFKHLALERWTAARELHTRALRNRSQVGFHTLRIGIKRFRYIVENFLPVEHKAWSGDLKHMQDLLGEVHDLDVLWTTALACHVFPDEESRNEWHEQIIEERTARIDEYRERTTGPDSLWNVWRAGLPQGERIQQIATLRMKLWARVLDPDFAHSERVARLALSLYDGLVGGGLLQQRSAGSLALKDNGDVTDVRASLNLAALLHDVGKAKGNKGHHKESLELIKGHGTPLGWKVETMTRAAIVARFHAGGLPSRSHKALRDLLPDEQRTTIQLAAILRLANAFDVAHDGHIRRVEFENILQSAKGSKRTNGFLRKTTRPGPNEALIIAAEGFVPGSSTAQAIAAERYLLETVLRHPVIVKAMRNPEPRRVIPEGKVASS
jgi:CHAD domain-containing protein